MTNSIQITCETDGSGHWSSRQATVKGTLKLYEILDRSSLQSEPQVVAGEAKFYWDDHDWYVPRHGLIYTDSRFIESLQEQLGQLGFNHDGDSSIYYTEQGMQGSDHVHMDISVDMLKQAKRLGFPVLQ